MHITLKQRTIHFLVMGALLTGLPGIMGASEKVALPSPPVMNMPLDEAMKKRRTVRSFKGEEFITLRETAGILFAMQGLTHGKKRTVPSAHAVYPLELYVAVRNIKDLPDGFYKMDIGAFALEPLKRGDVSDELAAACRGQRTVKKAQLRVIITCVWDRLTGKMGDAGKQWGIFEAGAASQNGFLAAAAMGLNTVPVGGFDPVKLGRLLGLAGVKETPVFVCVFGKD